MKIWREQKNVRLAESGGQRIYCALERIQSSCRKYECTEQYLNGRLFGMSLHPLWANHFREMTKMGLLGAGVGGIYSVRPSRASQLALLYLLVASTSALAHTHRSATAWMSRMDRQDRTKWMDGRMDRYLVAQPEKGRDMCIKYDLMSKLDRLVNIRAAVNAMRTPQFM